MKLKTTLAASLLAALPLAAENIYVSAQAEHEILTPWTEGMLEIHHINTGCGNAAFCILPDGTTLLIDAGHNSPDSERHVPAVPDESKTPGQWIAQYIRAHFPQGRDVQLDYVLLTHFDKDHIGGVLKKKSTQADYYLTGITEVAEEIPVMKIVDRGYPDYAVLPPDDEEHFQNYRQFTAYLQKQNPDLMEGFVVGTNGQFVLQHDAEAYPKFEIRNMVGNGVIWSGEGTETINQFPDDLNDLSSSQRPGENPLSCGIRISYGNFDYFNGGDMSGYPKPGRPAWHDLETPLAPILGKVEVANVNHHGYNDATNDTWLKTVSPQVLVMQASDALHPNHSTLYRMTSTHLYKPADIFSTNLHPAARIVIGDDLVEQMKSTQGHIVVRVSPGGSDYMVYVLDDSDEHYYVKQAFGPYFSVR